jgi:lipid II:glycine glycyltransferase (peptidoglycan interpeptide bridge formation enzyme)
VFELFSGIGKCVLLLALKDQNPLAGLIAFRNGDRSWYLYGASSDLERELMPTYLLQWEAMRWAKKYGCKLYDLWGIPDEDESVLESNFSERQDGLWGVYRFKRGFGGQVIRSESSRIKEYFPYSRYLYEKWWLGRDRQVG